MSGFILFGKTGRPHTPVNMGPPLTLPRAAEQDGTGSTAKTLTQSGDLRQGLSFFSLFSQ